MDSEERSKHLNILKMTLYIYTQIKNSILDRLAVESSSVFPDKSKGKKCAKKAKFVDTITNWDERQRTSFMALFKLLNFQLHKLWDPPVVDEEFVNMCANCCYKGLENPTIAYVKNKPLRNTIFQTIGVLIKKYNHGVNFNSKLVQLLSLYEHLVTPFAQAVVTFVQELGCKSLVSNILEELMMATEDSQDNTSIKTFSLFLVEIAGLEPEIMLPTMKELIKYLEKESYTMRICALSVITTVLVSHFSRFDMDEDSKEQRDLFLDILEDHMLDGNAFVRSKVLQLWQKVIQQNSLPKTRIVPLLEMTMRRLNDKSSVVCKSAIQLLRVILGNNPFSSKFGMAETTMKLLKEATRLDDMEKSFRPQKVVVRRELWDSVEPELNAFLTVTFVNKKDSKVSENDNKVNTDNSDNLNEDAQKKDESGESSGDQQDDSENLISKLNLVSGFIILSKFEEALSLMQTIIARFPEAPELKVDVQTKPETAYYSALMKKIFLLYGEDLSKDKPEEPQPDAISEADIEVQRKLVEYLTDSLEFQKCVDKGLEEVAEILHTKPISEVLEAIDLLTVAYQFGIPKACQVIPEMLDLVFSKEPGIKEAVTESYNTLYLTVDIQDHKERAFQIVKNLCFLIKPINYGQHEALTQLVIEWVKSGHIDDHCIKVILEDIVKNVPTLNEELILLEMIGREKPKIIADNLPLLVKRSFSFILKDVLNDKFLQSAYFTLQGLHNLTQIKLPTGNHARYPSDHRMIQALEVVIKKSFLLDSINDINFITVATQNINLLFKLSNDPKKVSESLLMALRDQLKEHLTKSYQKSDTNKQGETLTCSTSVLTRYIFVVGHVAFNIIIYLEETHLETLKKKYRDEVKEKALAKKDNLDTEKKKKSKQQIEEESEDFLRYEMDAIAAADDKATVEINQMLENQVLNSSETIGLCSNFIINVCKNPTRYKNSLLQCVAATSILKLMLVSSVYCKEHLQLLITMLEKSPEESVRVSIVLGLGDLLLRFPNVVEPWTKFLYNRLKDESHTVRITTLIVIYYLVSNEMIKVKGQISLVALCIIDVEKDISDIAHQFFTEIAAKGNTLYNVLPDIISNLSNPDAEEKISEENFQAILKFLMSQIQKERQTESLVEKICKRIHSSQSERQAHDLSFCLSLLQWSDRSLRKLLDLANCYADKLSYPPIGAIFQQIGSNVVKSTRPGLKEVGIEFNNIIEEILDKGSEALKPGGNSRSSMKTPSKPSRITSRTPSAQKKNLRTARKIIDSKIVEDSEESLDNSDEEPQRRTTRKTKKTTKYDHEDKEMSSDSDNDSEVFQKSKSTKKTRHGRALFS
uniref:Condensin complex subunit 1 n=2 Tax=Clastoptera arizonana TaxID=38151 RepID=A0A1B6C062_9HEMI